MASRDYVRTLSDDDEEEAQPDVGFSNPFEEPQPAPFATPLAQPEHTDPMAAFNAGQGMGGGSAGGSAQPDIKSILLKKYADAETQGNEDIKAAQQKQMLGGIVSGIAQAAEGVARAPGIARGGPGVNHASYQQVNNQLANNVNMARQGKQAGMDKVLKEHTLGKQLDDEAQLAAQRDPNSDISKNFRSFVQSTYPDLKIPDGMSYADAKEKVPMMAAAHDAQQTKLAMAEQKSRELKYYRDSLDQRRREFAQTRDDAKTDKDFTSLTDHLKGSVRDSIGQEKTKLRNATHAQALLHGNLDNLSNEQVQEIAGALAGQVSGGGQAAESIIHNMTPKTIKGDLAKLASYIGGSPTGAGQGDYMKMYRDMIQRQMDTSKQIIAGEYQPVVANFRHLAKKDPERLRAILQGAGVDMDPKTGQIMAYEPAYAKSENKEQPPMGPAGKPGTAIAAPGPQYIPPEQHPQKDEALAWAKANPTDPRAVKILQQFGGMSEQPFPFKP